MQVSTRLDIALCGQGAWKDVHAPNVRAGTLAIDHTHNAWSYNRTQTACSLYGTQ